ncbi:MAG: AhpC/TSA family protein [Chitinophagaceae bacterium]|nr:AhpC/TSA family protein [Chitinophagaceae bacterium]
MKLIHAAALALLPAMLNANHQLPDTRGEAGISLQLKGLLNGRHVYLLSKKDPAQSNMGPKFYDTVASAMVANGTAEFSTSVNDAGKLYMVAIDGEKALLTLLISNNDKIAVRGSLEEWPNMKVSGSKGTAQMAVFRKYFSSVIVHKEGVAISQSIIDFVASHPDNIYVPLVLLQTSSMTNEERKIAFDKLSATAKNSYYGKKLAIAMNEGNMNQPLREGYLIPDFKLRMLDGDTLSIRQIAAKNKLTLVDYWGTWCGPCVAEFPHLKEVYARFKSKGFSILGITKGENESGWRKAIDSYGINWQHGSDDIDNARDKVFRIHAVPAYALIDQEGKMIAFLALGSDAAAPFGPYIFGEDLDKTLEKILK